MHLSILTLDYCWQLKSKEEQEGEVVARIRTALALGMSVLDTMFDAVEVPVSDSEDEERWGMCWFMLCQVLIYVLVLTRLYLLNFTTFIVNLYLSIFHYFTVHFDSLSFIHTNSCTFSYNYVSVF